MNMFGYDHVSVNTHLKALAHLFQAEHKQVVGVGRVELGGSAITTKGEEVGTVETGESVAGRGV